MEDSKMDSSSSSSSKEATHQDDIHEPTVRVHPCFFLQALRDILRCLGFSSSDNDIHKSLPDSTSTSETPLSNSTGQDPPNTENSANPLLESARTPTRPDKSKGSDPKIN